MILYLLWNDFVLRSLERVSDRDTFAVCGDTGGSGEAGVANEFIPRATDPQMTVSATDQPAISQINAEKAQGAANTAQFGAKVAAAGSAGNFAELSAIVAQQAAATGQGFQLSPEQIDYSIKEIDQQLVNLDTRYHTIGLARYALRPPSPDPASIAFNNATMANLTAAGKVIQSHQNALMAFQQNLRIAKQNYMNQEHLTADQWNRLANGLNH